MIFSKNHMRLTGALSAIFYFTVCFEANAQLIYDFETNIAVSANNAALQNPWVGGFNSPQYNTMDLNGDGQQDLVVFDRTSFSLKTFLATEGKYVYAPHYQSQFPEIRNWVLIRDYNCDGNR